MALGNHVLLPSQHTVHGSSIHVFIHGYKYIIEGFNIVVVVVIVVVLVLLVFIIVAVGNVVNKLKLNLDSKFRKII